MKVRLDDIYYTGSSLDAEGVGTCIVLAGPANRGPVMHPYLAEGQEIGGIFGFDSALYREWHMAKVNGAVNIYLIRTNGCHPTFSFGTKLILAGIESAKEDPRMRAWIDTKDSEKVLYLAGHPAYPALTYPLTGTMDALVEEIQRDATGGKSGFMVLSWESGNAADLGEVDDVAVLDLGTRDGTEIKANTQEVLEMLIPYPVAQIGIVGMDADELVDAEKTLYQIVSECAAQKQELGIPALYTLGLSEDHPTLLARAEGLVETETTRLSPWICVTTGLYETDLHTGWAITGVGAHLGIIARRADNGGTVGSVAIGVTDIFGTEDLSKDQSLSNMGFTRYCFRNDLYGRQHQIRVGGSGSLMRSKEPTGALQSVANMLVLQRIMFALHDGLMDLLPDMTDNLLSSIVETILSSSTDILDYEYAMSKALVGGAYVRTVQIEIRIPGEINRLSFEMKSR